MGRKKRQLSKKMLYPLVGFALSFSAPLGWFVLRFYQLATAQNFGGWTSGELQSNLLLYGYMYTGAVLILMFSGFSLGYRDDKIREHYGKVTSQRRLLSIKNRQLARLTVTDQLTGLANRTKLMESLALEFKRAFRYNSDLCVIVVDVDYFKRINDTYGHIYGDFVLNEMGQIFASNRRETDYVSRMGGEEFSFILTETKVEDALRFAERLREAVANYKFEYKGIKVPVKISLGVASIRDIDPQSNDDRGQCLYTAADEALYLAKHLGRNRVVRYDSKTAKSLTA